MSWSLLLLLLLIPGLLPAADHARELKVIKDQIQQARKDEERARRQQGSILQELDNANRWLSDLNNELTKLAGDIAEAETRIVGQEQEIRELTDALAGLQETFARRLRIRYCRTPGKWLDFLAGEADLRDKLNALVYVRSVLNADRSLWQENARLRQQATVRGQELEKRRTFLVELREREARKIAELEESIAKKNDLLYKIQHQVNAHQELVRELEKVAAGLQRLTRDKGDKRSDFASFRGNLAMPVDGVVVSFFGIEKDERFAGVTRNRGIEIEAPLGAPVKAVYAGQVVYASWMKGYGRLLVLDHGEGYYSVYGYLEEFSCQVNDQVAAAEIIGRVGRGGLSRSPTLYFEIRREGVPEDPLTWVTAMLDS